LVPIFDDVPLLGVHAENPATESEFTKDFHSYHMLRFVLRRNTSNREAWKGLLNGFSWNGRPVKLSVGFEKGDPMYTWVQKEKPPANSPDAKDVKTFTLVVLPHSSTIIAAVLFLIAVATFLWLVKATEILQDVNAPLRPDGKAPYSLARLQMAVWFFLVV